MDGAKAAVADLDAKDRVFGEIYLKIMKSILKKGDDYVEKVRRGAIASLGVRLGFPSSHSRP